MALDPAAARLLAQLEAQGDPTIATAEPEVVRRAWRERLTRSPFEVPGVRDLDAAGIPCRLYPGTRGGLFVYFHGGGWALGDLDTCDDVCRALAVGSRQSVLSVGYRLAPEHPYPAGLEDAAAASRWAAEHAADLGCQPGRLAIGGDSAGGNLAAVVVQRGLLPWVFQLLIYPATDARRQTDSHRTETSGALLTPEDVTRSLELYLRNGGSVDDPEVSPLLGSDAALAHSPPTLVVTAEHDPLRDEGEQYAARLAALGVPVTLRRYDGMFHGFMSFAARLERGRTALAEAALALSRGLA